VKSKINKHLQFSVLVVLVYMENTHILHTVEQVPAGNGRSLTSFRSFGGELDSTPSYQFAGTESGKDFGINTLQSCG